MKVKIVLILVGVFSSCKVLEKKKKEQLNYDGYLSYNISNQSRDYYFFKVTVKIIMPKEKILYTPQTFTKFSEKKTKFRTHKYQLPWGDLYDKWSTTYEVKNFPNDTKEVLGFEGHKVVIFETSKRTFDVYEEVYELYVSNKFNYPFVYYEFLNLKKPINLFGLILECKTYYKESPNLNVTFKLKSFNSEKQDNTLKSIDFENFIYRKL